MNGFDRPLYLQLYILANVIALVLLALSWKFPRWARWGFVLLFAWASWTNATTAYRDPGVYLEYADLTFLPVYRRVILGAFSEHVALYVSLIAMCQFMIAGGLALGGVLARIAALGAMLFLMAIAPFGVGSGFPCTLIFALALYVLLRRGLQAPVWRASGEAAVLRKG
jgi:hypothetical protein